MISRFFLNLTGITLMLLATSCSEKSQKAEKTKLVILSEVKSASPEMTIQYPGKVKAAEDANLSFKVAGRISRMVADEGQFVRKGQVLAEMDATDYNLQLKATEAEYAQIKGDCERIIALYNDSATTKSNYDKAVSGLQQISAKLENHRNQVAYTKITAPYDGYVQKHLMAANEIVGAGMPVISMMSSKTLEVEVNLPATDYIRRNQMKKFTCLFDVLPGQTFDLKLTNMTPKANSNQLYPIRLQLESCENVTVGMNTTVCVSMQQDDTKELRVPTSAVRRDGEKSHVFVFNNDRVQECEVDVRAVKTDGTCIVISDELKSGDKIVSSGIHHIDNGDKVREVKNKSNSNVGELL
ncbi:MAG: efflux RND transporter periplasmic adaptor subunit [Bacteroidales bacterium]|nr:efflux RND transporter periplasmic adaptor subunit [Bacteroidales bacterium]